MDVRMALNREQWDNSNMTKDLLGIGFDMVVFQVVQNHGELN